MLEGIAPMEHGRGLYDEIAQIVREIDVFSEDCAFYCPYCDSGLSVKDLAHIQPKDLRTMLINKLVIALRRDNPRFNELRFRQHCTK